MSALCLHAYVVFSGTTDELVENWRKEAEGLLGMRANGYKMELFKVVGERRVSVPLSHNICNHSNINEDLSVCQAS